MDPFFHLGIILATFSLIGLLFAAWLFRPSSPKLRRAKQRTRGPSSFLNLNS